MKIERILIKVNRLIKLVIILLMIPSCNSQRIVDNIAEIDYEIYLCEGFNNDNINFSVDENDILTIENVVTDKNTGFTSIDLKIVKYRSEYYLINKKMKIEKKIDIQDLYSIKVGMIVNKSIYKEFNISRREGRYILINKNINDLEMKQSFIPPIFD